MDPNEFMSKIPDKAKERLYIVANKTGVDLNTILEEYYEVYNDTFRYDMQFVNDKDRHEYVSKVVMSRFLNRPPVKKFDIIPIGYSRIRNTRSGPMCRLYAIVKDRGLTPIVCRDRYVNIHEYVSLFHKYTVKLIEFSDGTLGTDPRTKFEDPVPISSSPSDLIDKLNIPRITIAEAKENPSRRRSDGFVDDTDWRVIRGIIVRQKRGVDKNGLEFGVCTIVDETSTEERVLPDGRVLPPGMTVWVSPSQMIWANESELDFYGTIELDENGIPFMNCFLMLPVHAIQNEG